MTPLAIDLDETLIRTDALHESVLKLLKVHPLVTLLLPLWLIRGRAYLKRKLMERVHPNPSLLPYNRPLLAWLEDQKAARRELHLVTASDQKLADQIAAHVGLFDSAVGSHDGENLKGPRKRTALEDRFGEQNFSYAGDARADLAVWAGAKSAVVVSDSKSLIEKARKVCNVEMVFERQVNKLPAVIKLLRPHQWAKNLLVFMPALAAHQLQAPAIWTLTCAFLAFSLCSAGVYIINDLLDIEADRAHQSKKNRPLAAGSVTILFAVSIIPILIGLSALLSSQIGESFMNVVAVYFCLTLLYSTWLKQLVLIDCLTLAGLYTLRVAAGAAAISISLSFWLITFSVFLFCSLAFVKRSVELTELGTSEQTAKLNGRGYLVSDSLFVNSIGVAMSLMAVLVLALYINSPESVALYQTLEMVWAAVGVFLFWISRIWLLAGRGEMNEDPVVFALTDRVSLICGALFLCAVYLGTWSFAS